MCATNPVFNLGELQKVLVAPHSDEEAATIGLRLTPLTFSTAFPTSWTWWPPSTWRTWRVSPLSKWSISPFIKKEEYVRCWHAKLQGPNAESVSFILFSVSWSTNPSTAWRKKETGLITEWIQNSHFTVAVLQVHAQTCLPAQQKHTAISLNSLSWNWNSFTDFFFFFYLASWSLLCSQLLFKWELCPGVTYQRGTHIDGN